jgi:hypothetical protein
LCLASFLIVKAQKPDFLITISDEMDLNTDVRSNHFNSCNILVKSQFLAHINGETTLSITIKMLCSACNGTGHFAEFWKSRQSKNSVEKIRRIAAMVSNFLQFLKLSNHIVIVKQ